MHGELDEEKIEGYVAELKHRRAARADKTVNEFLKHGEDGMITSMAMMHD